MPKRRERPPTTKEAWADFANSPQREKPARLSESDYRSLSAIARARYDRVRKDHHASLGPYPVGDNGRGVAEALRLLETNDRLPSHEIRRGMAFDGPPLVGKSTMLRWLGRMYERGQRDLHGFEMEDGNEFVPVLFVCVPSIQRHREFGVKAFNERIINYYNIPVPSRDRTTTGLTRRIHEHMWRCGTSLALIDDVHNIEQGRDAGRALNDHFKNFMNEVACTYVFGGVGLEEGGLFSEGLAAEGALRAQLSGRLRRFAVGPADISSGAGFRDWRALLGSIDRDLRLLVESSGLAQVAMAHYLFERTGGLLGELMELVRHGSNAAVDREAAGEAPTGLTVELFDRVRLSYGTEAATRAQRAQARRRRAA